MTQVPNQSPSTEAQAAKLRGILESAVTAIITIDERGLIENINPATERLFLLSRCGSRWPQREGADTGAV
jgi:hypothetical protein